MGKSNKQHLEDAWKEFERTGEICNAASGLLDYATVLVEINRLQSEENKQLAEDNAKLREALQEVDAGLINRSVVDAFKTCENQGLSIEDCLHDAILTYFENLTAEIDG